MPPPERVTPTQPQEKPVVEKDSEPATVISDTTENTPAPEQITQDKVSTKGRKTRKIDGKAGDYRYDHGMRTHLNADGSEDTDGNIAVVKDPFFGLGKKQFTYIQGLDANVDAKIVKKHIQGEQEKQEILKVKNDKGETTYYTINIDETGNKSLGDELVEIDENGNKVFRKKEEKHLSAES